MATEGKGNFSLLRAVSSSAFLLPLRPGANVRPVRIFQGLFAGIRLPLLYFGADTRLTNCNEILCAAGTCSLVAVYVTGVAFRSGYDGGEVFETR